MPEIEYPKKMQWAQLPTPIQHLPRLSEECGVNLYVKRDDFTGFEWSGNKIRKLEFLVRDAQDKGATCLVTCGGVQSNHCRATAALAAKLGLRCVLVLRGEEPKGFSSNNLLDRLFGAEILYVTTEQYRDMHDIQITIDAQVRGQGGKSYFIPEGGSNGLGSFGYAHAWDEILAQTEVHFDSVVVAHGSGGTQAGLVLGKILRDQHAMHRSRVIGVNVCYDKQQSFQLVKKALWEAIQHQHIPISFLAEDIEILDGFVGRGYALSTPEELRFLAKVARLEGLLLDPVYTGKAMYGLYKTLKNDPKYFGKNILFIHTGGGFGNFQWNEEWQGAFK